MLKRLGLTVWDFEPAWGHLEPMLEKSGYLGHFGVGEPF